MISPTTSPFRKFNPMLIAAVAFVLGGAGTAFVMSSLRRPKPPPVPAEGAQPAAPSAAEADAGAEKGRIHLSAEAKETAGIRSEPAHLRPMGESLTVPGTVEVSPNRGAKITPPVSGKVVRLLAGPGDAVRMGQPLAVLDSYEVAQARAAVRQAEGTVQQARAAIQTAQAETSQVRTGIRQSQAEIEQAQTRQTSAETALGRQREFAAAGAFSQAPLLAAQSEVAGAQSDLLQAQTNLQAHTVVLQRAEKLFKADLISRAALEQARLEPQQDQIQVDRAKTRVESAKQALSREQKISSGDLLTKQAVQTAEAEVRSAQGDVQRARQGLFRARQDVLRAQQGEQAARTSRQGAESALSAVHANLYALTGKEQADTGGLITLCAPFAGTVAERAATLGEAVERSTSLFVLENLDAVTVSASVAEKDVARVRIGQPVQVTVTAYPQQTFPGIVQSIASRIDDKTRALAVRCLVQNPGGRLKPEMFAKVALGVGARKETLAVPLSALDEDGGASYLYVEEGDGYERRKVETGRRAADRIEIRSGLKSGEKVVSAGVFVLKSESKKGELKGDGD